MKFIDLTNVHFGRLTVIKLERKDKKQGAYWLCKCDCGGNRKPVVLGKHLRSGKIKSCGCLRSEVGRKIGRKYGYSNGLNNRGRVSKHGNCRFDKTTCEYVVWHNMKNRCYNSNYDSYYRYGGRGIKVYKPWRKSFKKFLKYLLKTIGLRPGKGYSLDRIDNDGNYEPGNIKWSTAKQQANNRSYQKKKGNE